MFKNSIFVLFVLLLYTSCSQKPTLKGNFQSIKGVMDPLSCYCYNGGYITTSSNEKIPICFSNDDEDVPCKNLEVSGNYKSIKIQPDSNNPCPSGEMNIFFVTKYTCK